MSRSTSNLSVSSNPSSFCKLLSDLSKLLTALSVKAKFYVGLSDTRIRLKDYLHYWERPHKCFGENYYYDQYDFLKII